MKHLNVKIFVLLSLLFSSIVFSQQKGFENKPVTKLPSKEKRWALIIGVDAYQKDISPLYGTVNDAKALRDVLIKYAGFADERIILMTTDSDDSDLIPTRGNIIDQLDKLSRVVPEEGLILFSFSGHGVSIGSDAFIVPADGRIYQNADLMRERAIDVLRIRQAIQATKVKQVIMFLDACRNDPVRAKGDADNNLTTAYAKGFSFETKNQNIEAYATLYATSFGDRAYEFLDKKTNKYRGYFSYAIEEGLKGSAANDKGEVTLAGLIRYIEDTVKERVRINENQRQIPYPTTEGFRNSDLVIAVADRNTPIIINPNSGEAAFWNSIENSNDVSDFEEYLRRAASGEFSGIYKATAELKLVRLKKANIAAAWTKFSSTARLLLKYEFVGAFTEELSLVILNDKTGFMDKTGREVVPLKYDAAYEFSEGFAKVKLNYKYGFIDKTGREVVPPKYDDAGSFSEGLAAVELNDKWGFIDKTGKEIIPPKYKQMFIPFFSDGLANVMVNDKYGFIDKTGKDVIPFKFDIFSSSFSEGLAAVSLKGKWIFIDKTGGKIVSLKYAGVSSLSEGLSLVQLNLKFGFIDKNGKEIIPLKYDLADSFSDGLARVGIGYDKNIKWGLIDKTGREVVPPKYSNIPSEFSEGLVMVNMDNKLGLIDRTGKEIVPPIYDYIWCWAFVKEGFIGVWLNGKKGFVDIYGNEYFDFKD